MQYKSPIKALSHFLHPNENFENLNIVTLKKRVLAEFELSGKTNITTSSGEFSKSDLLSVLDELKASENIEYHLIIAKFPQLVNLLENYKITEAFSFSDPVFKDDKFVNFLSPYVAYALGKYYSSYLEDPKRYMTYTLQKNLPVLHEHIELLTKPVFEAIDSLINSINKAGSKFNGSKKLPDARFYFKNNVIRVVNHLPHKYFASVIDMYATAGYNFIVAYLQNRDKHRWFDKIATEIYFQIRKIRANREIIAAINGLKKYFEPEEDSAELDSNNGCYNTLKIVGIVIAILVFIARFASRC